MKTAKRTLAIFLAVICVLSVFSVNGFAATKYKDYKGKYGKIIPVEADYKTVCECYEVNGTKGDISFSFKSKGHEKNVYYGITIYSDKEMQNILINIGKPFPTVNSYGSISIDFTPLESGVYYGIAYTFISSGGNYIVDSSSIYTYEIKVNKVGDLTAKITEANALADCNYIKWSKVKYADGYYVYRKQAGSPWERIASTKKLSYKDKDIAWGEKYYYTVRAFDESSSFKSLYNKKGVPLIFLAPTVFGKTEFLADNEIKISWAGIKGADSYRVYRKTDGGSYKRLATVSGDVTEYIDKTPKENGAYLTYMVRALNETCLGLPSNELNVSVFGIFKPQLSCDSESVKISWDEVEGATYTLFKKQADGWLPIASNTTLTEISDYDISLGEEYCYSLVVHLYNMSSSFDSKGVSVWCLEEPKIKSLSNKENDSVLVKWGSVDGATSYNVYRKVKGGELQLVGNTGLTAFYDSEDKKSNLNYEYCVQALGEGSASSHGENVKAILYMAAPELSSVEWDGDGNVIKWKRVAGATSYRVYRRTPSGSYKKIADVTNTLEFVDTTAKKNDKYYYTVKAVNGKIAGAFEIGKGANCLDAPVLLSVDKNKSGNVSVKWESVENASGYYVYRKTESGKWTKLGKTAKTSYTDKTAKTDGEKYVYTVKAYNSEGSGIYNAQGLSVIY